MDQSNYADARRWVPAVAHGDAPFYQRLADAVADAIRDGSLGPGMRLPTQRALADSLGVSVGTTNSAYIEAERRGLVRRHVGRGTFVASTGTRALAPSGQVNLAINVPPFHAAAPMIRALLRQLIEDVDATELLGYPLFRANGRYATAAADWVSRTTCMGPVRPERLVPSQGAFQGLLATMDYLFKRGDSVACEQVTYGGFKVMARVLGLRLVPCEQDDEGLTPDGLERAARTEGIKGVALCATHQNPIGTIASVERREHLLAVARRRNLWVVEDDVYGSLATRGRGAIPFAALDAERTFSVASASKSIAPGLRAGWVIPPPEHRAGIASVLNARMEAIAPYGCPVLTAGAAPFGFLAFAKMCETRMADDVLQSIRQEARVRLASARRILGPHLREPADDVCLHAWLPMTRDGAEAIHQRLGPQGVYLTPPGVPMVGTAPTGIRLCLGGPERLPELEHALHLVRSELEHLGSGAGAVHP